jgi:phage terminase large subunit GpA-like protein
MTSEEHIDGILERFCQQAKPKYMAGAREHGGQLWEKDGQIDNIIEEAIDLIVYAYTLKDQLEKIKELVSNADEKLQEYKASLEEGESVPDSLD